MLRDNYLQTQAISIAEAQGAAPARPAGALHARRWSAPASSTARSSSCPTTRRSRERWPQRPGPDPAGARRAARLRQDRRSTTSCSQSDLPDDPLLRRRSAVAISRRRCASASRTRSREHRLRREIIATQVVNSLINRVGRPSSAEMREHTGAPADDVARAYLGARDAFALRDLGGDRGARQQRCRPRCRSRCIWRRCSSSDRALPVVPRNRPLPLDTDGRSRSSSRC